MNLIPKTNLWVSKTVQVMRMSSTGSSGPIKTGGTFEQKPVDLKKSSDSSKDDEPTEAPKSFSPYSNDPPTLEVPASDPLIMHEKKAPITQKDDPQTLEVPASDPLYIMHEKKAPNNPKGVVNQDIVEHLKSYFDDQIIYYKTMANYNKCAMKRIKKIKKTWTKMLD